jgi:hypothetical protein
MDVWRRGIISNVPLPGMNSNCQYPQRIFEAVSDCICAGRLSIGTTGEFCPAHPDTITDRNISRIKSELKILMAYSRGDGKIINRLNYSANRAFIRCIADE